MFLTVSNVQFWLGWTLASGRCTLLRTVWSCLAYSVGTLGPSAHPGRWGSNPLSRGSSWGWASRGEHREQGRADGTRDQSKELGFGVCAGCEEHQEAAWASWRAWRFRSGWPGPQLMQRLPRLISSQGWCQLWGSKQVSAAWFCWSSEPDEAN